MKNIPPNTIYGSWQPLGCHFHNKRSLAGGMPHLSYKGFTHRTFFPLPLTHGISGSFTRKKTLALARVLQSCTEASGGKQGILCGAVRELQQCMASLMTINEDDVMEASLLRPFEEEQGTFPHQEEEPTLLGQGRRALRSPRLFSLTSKESSSHRTDQVGYCSSDLHCTPL